MFASSSNIPGGTNVNVTVLSKSTFQICRGNVGMLSLLKITHYIVDIISYQITRVGERRCTAAV